MSLSDSHDHTPASYGRSFAIGIALNIGFVIIEASYGWHSQSLALLADAGHNLSDVAGLLLAWAAVWRLHDCDLMRGIPMAGGVDQFSPALPLP